MNKITPEIVALFVQYTIDQAHEDHQWELARAGHDLGNFHQAVRHTDAAYRHFGEACSYAGLDHGQTFNYLKCQVGMPTVSLPNGTQIEWPYYSKEE